MKYKPMGNKTYEASEPRPGDIWMVRMNISDTEYRIVPVTIISCADGRITYIRCRRDQDPRSEMYPVRDILQTGLSGTVFLDRNRETCKKQNLERKIGTLSNRDMRNSKWR